MSEQKKRELSWQLNFRGLKARASEGELAVKIEQPIPQEVGYGCRLTVEGVIDQTIFAETQVSALRNAICILDDLLNEPSPLLENCADLTPEVLPDLSVEIG